MQDLSTKTVRDIALEYPQTTRIFENYKIDYCCGGRRPLAEACAAAGADAAEVLNQIEAAQGEPFAGYEPKSEGTLAQLIAHILDVHHVFTRDEIAALGPLMAKVARKHGENHPELMELEEKVNELFNDLSVHMMKEERILFPYIERLEYFTGRSLGAPVSPFGSVQNPVRMMTMEHDTAGDILKRMREVTNDYTVPPGACPSYTGLYHRLANLERDLHQHIHLENNLLFPKAIEMEDSAASAAA